MIRFRVPSKNYTSLLKRAKYCLVTEGFSPWSPRLTEAVAHGCVALRTLVLPSTAKKVRAKKNGSVVPCAATSKGAARSLSLSFRAELALEPGDELTIQLA